ncbi:hypothetical protein CAPTEDRAFT_208938 [Capitella teleta]|uniref:Uncharacterized protein n=1 Tax=Capitella teleta TaxID=283909 RepID=R7V8A5_CAPTE|nr:hypothetical protein CAPTEDRAFT_208938 [Capitella teleta]|eukprot:ELU15088.1 hypothetical protein CAPTEDRAFT_208938 [Capitella teleta]
METLNCVLSETDGCPDNDAEPLNDIQSMGRKKRGRPRAKLKRKEMEMENNQIEISEIPNGSDFLASDEHEIIIEEGVEECDYYRVFESDAEEVYAIETGKDKSELNDDGLSWGSDDEVTSEEKTQKNIFECFNRELEKPSHHVKDATKDTSDAVKQDLYSSICNALRTDRSLPDDEPTKDQCTIDNIVVAEASLPCKTVETESLTMNEVKGVQNVDPSSAECPEVSDALPEEDAEVPTFEENPSAEDSSKTGEENAALKVLYEMRRRQLYVVLLRCDEWLPKHLCNSPDPPKEESNNVREEAVEAIVAKRPGRPRKKRRLIKSQKTKLLSNEAQSATSIKHEAEGKLPVVGEDEIQPELCHRDVAAPISAGRQMDVNGDSCEHEELELCKSPYKEELPQTETPPEENPREELAQGEKPREELFKEEQTLEDHFEEEDGKLHEEKPDLILPDTSAVIQTEMEVKKPEQLKTELLEDAKLDSVGAMIVTAGASVAIADTAASDMTAAATAAAETAVTLMPLRSENKSKQNIRTKKRRRKKRKPFTHFKKSNRTPAALNGSVKMTEELEEPDAPKVVEDKAERERNIRASFDSFISEDFLEMDDVTSIGSETELSQQINDICMSLDKSAVESGDQVTDKRLLSLRTCLAVLGSGSDDEIVEKTEAETAQKGKLKRGHYKRKKKPIVKSAKKKKRETDNVVSILTGCQRIFPNLAKALNIPAENTEGEAASTAAANQMMHEEKLNVDLSAPEEDHVMPTCIEPTESKEEIKTDNVSASSEDDNLPLSALKHTLDHLSDDNCVKRTKSSERVIKTRRKRRARKRVFTQVRKRKQIPEKNFCGSEGVNGDDFEECLNGELRAENEIQSQPIEEVKVTNSPCLHSETTGCSPLSANGMEMSNRRKEVTVQNMIDAVTDPDSVEWEGDSECDVFDLSVPRRPRRRRHGKVKRSPKEADSLVTKDLDVDDIEVCVKPGSPLPSVNEVQCSEPTESPVPVTDIQCSQPIPQPQSPPCHDDVLPILEKYSDVLTDQCPQLTKEQDETEMSYRKKSCRLLDSLPRKRDEVADSESLESLTEVDELAHVFEDVPTTEHGECVRNTLPSISDVPAFDETVKDKTRKSASHEENPLNSMIKELFTELSHVEHFKQRDPSDVQKDVTEPVEAADSLMKTHSEAARVTGMDQLAGEVQSLAASCSSSDLCPRSNPPLFGPPNEVFVDTLEDWLSSMTDHPPPDARQEPPLVYPPLSSRSTFHPVEMTTAPPPETEEQFLGKAHEVHMALVDSRLEQRMTCTPCEPTKMRNFHRPYEPLLDFRGEAMKPLKKRFYGDQQAQAKFQMDLGDSEPPDAFRIQSHSSASSDDAPNMDIDTTLRWRPLL